MVADIDIEIQFGERVGWPSTPLFRNYLYFFLKNTPKILENYPIFRAEASLIRLAHLLSFPRLFLNYVFVFDSSILYSNHFILHIYYIISPMFASTYSAYFEAELFGNCNRFFRQKWHCYVRCPENWVSSSILTLIGKHCPPPKKKQKKTEGPSPFDPGLTGPR